MLCHARHAHDIFPAFIFHFCHILPPVACFLRDASVTVLRAAILPCEARRRRRFKRAMRRKQLLIRHFLPRRAQMLAPATRQRRIARYC
jgi:hypothetical protein